MNNRSQIGSILEQSLNKTIAQNTAQRVNEIFKDSKVRDRFNRHIQQLKADKLKLEKVIGNNIKLRAERRDGADYARFNIKETPFKDDEGNPIKDWKGLIGAISADFSKASANQDNKITVVQLEKEFQKLLVKIELHLLDFQEFITNNDVMVTITLQTQMVNAIDKDGKTSLSRIKTATPQSQTYALEKRILLQQELRQIDTDLRTIQQFKDLGMTKSKLGELEIDPAQLFDEAYNQKSLNTYIDKRTYSRIRNQVFSVAKEKGFVSKLRKKAYKVAEIVNAAKYFKELNPKLTYRDILNEILTAETIKPESLPNFIYGDFFANESKLLTQYIDKEGGVVGYSTANALAKLSTIYGQLALIDGILNNSNEIIQNLTAMTPEQTKARVAQDPDWQKIAQIGNIFNIRELYEQALENTT